MCLGAFVQASRIFVGGGPDRELIAADAQTARCPIFPLHENLNLVGVPGDTHAANAASALLDLISLAWNVVVLQPHVTSPLYARAKLAEGPTGPPPVVGRRQPAPSRTRLLDQPCSRRLNAPKLAVP
jgi:hypothetical protein